MMIDSDRVTLNTNELDREFKWFEEVLRARADINRNLPERTYNDVYDVEPPDIEDRPSSDYARFVVDNDLALEERFVLLLALAPYLRPRILDVFLVPEGSSSGFGGRKGKNHKGFLPTGETVMFVLAGNDLHRRTLLHSIFTENHLFARQQVLWLEGPAAGEPRLSGALQVSETFLDRITTGTVSVPRFGQDFPAKLLETEMEWDDLVLHPETRQRLNEMEHWIGYQATMMGEWGLGKRVKPGFKALFYGPPGTGKSITAAILGKQTGKLVFRVDLSKMVSKYIGETEKNLSKVFDQAENKDWILFFDEADALFGKRTNVKDSHDKYANQEVSYLLQRIEDFNGLAILASNFKSNIDTAFMRRFKAIIHFPMPDPNERKKLWEVSFSSSSRISSDIDLWQIAREHEMAGGSIINVVEYCSILALSRGSRTIIKDDLLQGIKNEYAKIGRNI